jgi:type IV pilus assembly protein PilX
MTHPRLNRLPQQQRGAVLIVSMLLLLVMTLLAMGASQSTRLQERMAGSQRNQDLAFQAAEAGLRAGERFVDNPAMTKPPLPCNVAPCQVYERGTLDRVVSYQNQAYENRAWWTARAQTYSATPQISGDLLAGQEPQYYVEELEEVPDSLTIPPTGPPPSRVFYRVVARGEGGTANAQVVLHSTYARRFN